ncbi:phage holin family protein [Helicobacter anatolicus]|uniref:phage holin family protein n=1 Tax=Helicobacter anatolicus TaxID=2905874 RepID=UPI001E2A84C5|nr:phage holin family protein [Helicobacter anatolicus]MCE3040471.1 phage holin family protein [Helicobacter anatolicus]
MNEMDMFLKNSFWLSYLLIIFVGAFSGAMYVMRTIEKEELDTRIKKLRYIIYGMGSSMLFTWIASEIGFYFGLPNSLSVALGGGIGFLGAECVTAFFLKFLQKKLEE